MKYIFSFLLIIFLYSCSNSAGYTVKHISTQVKTCCSTLCLQKTAACMPPAVPEKEAVSVIAVTVLERSAQLLTW